MKNKSFLTMCVTASLAIAMSTGLSANAGTYDDTPNNPACMVLVKSSEGPVFINVNYIREIVKRGNDLKLKMASNYYNDISYQVPLDKNADFMKEAESIADKINDCRANANSKYANSIKPSSNAISTPQALKK